MPRLTKAGKDAKAKRKVVTFRFFPFLGDLLMYDRGPAVSYSVLLDVARCHFCPQNRGEPDGGCVWCQII